MKTISRILFVIVVCIAFQAKAQTVSFTYDGDGNMTQRKVLSLGGPSGMKAEHKDTLSAAPVSDIIGVQKITIYPVPTKGIFQVAVTSIDWKQNNYFCIYSLSGAKLMQRKITNESTNVDISAYSSGTYLLDLFLGEKVSRWKVIKQ